MPLERDDKFAQVVATVQRRRDLDHRRITDMIDVRDRYNGDWVMPLPEIDDQEDLPAPVPYMIAEAIDQNAMRAASVMPAIEVPAVTANGRTRETARGYARIRRRALYANWDYSALQVVLFRSFRHFVGYGSNALEVVPDFKDRRARIVARDPLGSYPEPRDPEDVRPPNDVAYVYGRSRAWILNQYPEAAATLASYTAGGDDMWELFEWIDGEEIIVGLLGPRQPDWGTQPRDLQPSLSLPLRRWVNRAGRCTSYVSQRVTLDRVASQVAKHVPIADLHAHLTSLEVVGARKQVFGDKFVMADGDGEPVIVSGDGTWRSGVTGQMNLVKGAKQIGTLQDFPGPLAIPVKADLERALRINTGAIPQFAGETANAARTGRAIDALTSFAIDPRIQEMHVVMTYALRAINEMVLQVEAAYWPQRKYVVFSGWPSDRGTLEYTPATHFELEDGGKENAVAYPFPGADLMQTNLGVGQLIGMGLMSKRTARIKHPMIEDAEATQHEIEAEQIRTAFAVSYAQQLAGGMISLEDAAVIVREMEAGTDLLDAVAKAAEAARERQEQAAAAGPGAAGGQPGLQPAAPAVQAEAAAAANQATAAIPPTATAADRLRLLVSNLRATGSATG